MIREVLRFEIVYQLRRRSTWLFGVAGVGLAALASTSFVDDARGGGFPLDAPIVVAAIVVLSGMFGLLMVAPVAGDAATRDARTRMAPLLHATPLTERDYVLGRFLAAFTLAALLASIVPVALALVLRAPGLDPELAGPLRPGAYAGAYLLLGLPNAFVATALLFSAAVLGRRVLASYLCGATLFAITMSSKDLVAGHLGLWEAGKLLDPFGLTVLSAAWRAWPAAEKATRLLGLDASLLANRVFWLAAALGALALAAYRFRFARPLARDRQRRRRRVTPGDRARHDSASLPVPRAERRFGVATRARQVLAVAGSSCRRIFTRRVILVLPAWALFHVAVGPELTEGPLGTPSVPLTARVLPVYGDFTIGLLVAALVSWVAGELVWGERNTGLSELMGVTPVPDRVIVPGKLLALGLLCVAIQATFLAGGSLLQALQGHRHFELGLALRILFGIGLVDHLLFAVLALALHVVVNHKYVGHLAVLLTFLYTRFAQELGVEHDLLVYGSTPGWTYSDLGGFGSSLPPHRWLQLHWAGWALLWAVAATALWVRGRERSSSWRRIRLWLGHVGRGAAAAVGVGSALVLASGAYVLHATSGVNDRSSAAERETARAAYERRYRELADVAQPAPAAIRLRVEIHPERRRVEIRGEYRLENRGEREITTVHLTTHPEVETGPARFDRAARTTLVDDEIGFRSYRLGEPLRPGESLAFEIDVRVAPRGFPIPGVDTSVSPGSTLLEHLDADGASGRHWLPWIGYLADREIHDPGARREHGLAPRPRARALEDAAARHHGAGRERIDFEAIVGTVDDQVAVAPGRLLRSWVEGGRRYFHYATEAPIRNAFAVASAPYVVAEARWEHVRIQVLHRRGHAWNVERILRSARASLDAYTRRFGPYPHRWLRFVEIPGFATGLRAYPGMILFSEGFASLAPEADERGIDLPFAVVAHEVAHQWWGHQLVPAPVEGAPVLTESLAWYSAMGVVEEAYGRAHLERLLALMRREYLAPHARREVPLLRATDRLDVYRTAPLAMHELRERIGAGHVDAALRALLAEHGAGGPPYPTSLDLYRELQAVTPEPQQHFLKELFEEVPP